MADSKKLPRRERNREDVHEHLPFDEALRRLVNTPPSPRKKSAMKPERAMDTVRAGNAIIYGQQPSF